MNGSLMKRITDPKVHLPESPRLTQAPLTEVAAAEAPDFTDEELAKAPQTAAAPTSPVPHYYDKTFQGVTIDPARIARIYGVTDPMLFTALKKILRHGNGQHKNADHDVQEALDALNRYFEMQEEDK